MSAMTGSSVVPSSPCTAPTALSKQFSATETLRVATIDGRR